MAVIAQGVNLCNGASNSIVQDSHFRNTGDDSVATWSPKGQGGTNTNNTVRGVTAQLPWRANCFAVYGGSDHTVEDCRCFDTVSYPGVMINAGFNANDFHGTTTVRNTRLVRAGGPMYQPHTQPFGALVLWGQQFDVAGVLISGVTIDDATFSGVQIRGQHTISGAVLENTTITGSATYGLEVRSDAKGSATLRGVTIAGSGEKATRNGAVASFKLEQGVLWGLAPETARRVKPNGLARTPPVRHTAPTVP